MLDGEAFVDHVRWVFVPFTTSESNLTSRRRACSALPGARQFTCVRYSIDRRGRTNVWWADEPSAPFIRNMIIACYTNHSSFRRCK